MDTSVGVFAPDKWAFFSGENPQYEPNPAKTD
jgi:hypothetical protein